MRYLAIDENGRLYDRHNPDPITQAAEKLGRERGRADAGWVEIHSGNAAAILQGIEDGDPETLDMMPAPLSGEYAGESIPELMEESGLDRDEITEQGPEAVDDWCDAYEAAFSYAYWNEIGRTCRYHID